jgi:hypothetical protein
MQFPYLKLTTKEKIEQYGSVEKWCNQIIESLDKTFSKSWFNHPDDIYRLQVLFDLRAGKLVPSDFANVINELGFAKTESFPVQMKNYPLIPQICNTLLGEEMNRPSNEIIVQTNSDSVSELDNKKKEMIMEALESELHNALVDSGVVQEDYREVQTPEEINEYMNMSYRDIREVTAQQSLDFLKMYCNAKRKLDKNFDNLQTCGREIMYVGSYRNEPYMRVVNPLFFDFDRSPDAEYIEDGAWAREIEYISASEVHDRWGDVLTDAEVEKIERIKGTLSQQGSSGYGVPMFYKDDTTSVGLTHFDYFSSTVVRVVHCVWKSLRLVAFVTYPDENGVIQKTMVDEDYKETGKEIEVKWEWINEVWEATRIADDIIVNARPRPNQRRSVDNPSECKLPYVGLIYNRFTNNTEFSITSLLRSYQYLYNVIMYRFEHAIALSGPKAILFDIAQIPRSYGFDPDKWIYYLKTAGVAFTNSMEESKKGERSNFNQFQVLDMTLANSIQYYITILDKIESSAADLVGVTPQRRGDISDQELVGNVQQGIYRSSNVTEHLFAAHAEVKKRVYTALLEEAKICWRDGKKSQYVMDDMTRVFLNVDGEIFSSGEYGVFVSNAVDDVQIRDTVKTLAQSAVQNGMATLSGLVKVIRSKNTTKIEKDLEKMEQQLQQQKAQEAQQNAQAQQAVKQMEIEDSEKEREMKYLIAAEKNETTVRVAEIQSFALQKDQDSDDDGIPDQLEIDKLTLDKRRQDLEEIKVKLGLQKDNQEISLKKDQQRIDEEHGKEKLRIDEIKAKAASKKAKQTKKN